MQNAIEEATDGESLFYFRPQHGNRLVDPPSILANDYPYTSYIVHTRDRLEEVKMRILVIRYRLVCLLPEAASHY